MSSSRTFSSNDDGRNPGMPSDDSTANPSSSEQEETLAGAERTRQRWGRGKKFRQMFLDVGVLIRMVRAVTAKEYSLTLPQLTAILATLGYVASPVDLVPEAVLGPIGLGDDAAAVAVVVASLAFEIASFKQWERSRARGSATA